MTCPGGYLIGVVGSQAYQLYKSKNGIDAVEGESGSQFKRSQHRQMR